MTARRAAGRWAGRRAGLLAFALLGTAIGSVSLVGLLAVELTRDLGFGETGLGLAVSAFWLVTAVAAPLAGRWVDRRGWPVGAALGALVSALSLLVCVLFVSSWSGLVAVLALAGAGYALCSPTSNLLVVATVPARRMASVLGFKQTAPPVLLAVAGATLPVIAHRYGWRPAMAAGVSLPAAVLLGTWLLVRAGAPTPRHVAGGRRAVRDAEADTGAQHAPLRAAPVVVAAGLGTLSVATITGFAVLTLVGAGLPPVTAAAVVSAGSLLAVIARVASGWLLDARAADDLRPLLVVMGAAGLALAMVAAGTAVRGGGWLVVAGVVLSLVAAWTWPALLLLTVVRRAAEPGAASGLLQLGSGLGSAVGPMGFGLLSEAGGPGWAWLVMALATVAAMVLVHRSGRPGARTVRPARCPDSRPAARGRGGRVRPASQIHPRG